MSLVAAGVDFGGTNIKIGLVTRQGRLRGETVLSTRSYRRPAEFIDGLEQALTQLVHCQPRAYRLEGIGVGVPGLVDAKRGIIHRLVNVPGGWRGVALGRLLNRRFRRPCRIDNDANVVALGEWRFGAARKTAHSLVVTLGTGVGGGLIVQGRLLRGASGSAGEIGHTLIDPAGPRCGCGNRGCLEAYIGSAAVLRRATQVMRAHRRGALARWVQGGERVTPELLSRAAAAGDAGARGLWREVGTTLGQALASAVNLLNPECIVIGGGMAKAWPWFSPALRRTMAERAFEVPVLAVRLVRARLGDRGGILGAASLIWERTT